MDAVPHLLDAVTESGATLVGVSFHVGSGARNPNAFSEAILKARQVFDMARERGMELDLLDIGGGFMLSRAPDGSLSMGAVPAAINSALDMYFPPSSNVRIIAEPGRLFAEHAGVFASQVFGRRVRPDYTSVEGDMIREYWLADGLYGSFNCVLYDGAEVGEQSYRALSHPALETLSETERFTSTVFGPTCDGLDTVMRGVPLPEMRLGDFLVFDSFGAYTIAGACNFNGLKVDRVPTFVVVSERG